MSASRRGRWRVKRLPSPGRLVHRDAAAVGLHDVLDQRQARPRCPAAPASRSVRCDRTSRRFAPARTPGCRCPRPRPRSRPRRRPRRAATRRCRRSPEYFMALSTRLASACFMASPSSGTSGRSGSIATSTLKPCWCERMAEALDHLVDDRLHRARRRCRSAGGRSRSGRSPARCRSGGVSRSLSRVMHARSTRGGGARRARGPSRASRRTCGSGRAAS